VRVDADEPERVVMDEVLESAERTALREASPLRLKNTVPRKMATVTPKTPKFPQKAGLQPAAKSGAVIKNALRSETIPLQPGTSADDERAATSVGDALTGVRDGQRTYYSRRDAPSIANKHVSDEKPK
jgi:hypothetical protein